MLLNWFSASTLKLVGSESAGAAQLFRAALQSRVNTSRNSILATWKKINQRRKLFLEEEEKCYKMGAESCCSVGESGEESHGV